jgi:hypothetical protein
MPSLPQDQKSIYYPFLLLSVLTLGILSCSESPEPSTPPTTNPPVTVDPPGTGNPPITLGETFDELQGAWKLDHVSFQAEYRMSARKSGEFFDPFIEFLKDSTFLIIDAEENGFRGKYRLNEDEIELTGFGTIEDYSLATGKLIATIKKSDTGESVDIEAIKVAEAEIDEKTRKLMGEWYMVEEIGGNLFLGKDVTLYSKSGDPIIQGVIESVLVGFMPSGINYNMALIGGKLYMNELLYWKWKPNSDEIFIYEKKDQAPNDNSEGILIDQLSEENFNWYELWEGQEKYSAVFKRKL